jgi:hypothetical protein
MANTNKLRMLVEPELAKRFCESRECKQLKLTKKQSRTIFLNMSPDLVAYNNEEGILYIGEITVSG